MKIQSIIIAKTSSTKETTLVENLIGKPIPAAFLLNYGGYGFAKFRFDARSLAVFQHSLHKIESLEERKNVYNMLFDNVKSLRVAGSQALHAIKTALPHEQSEECLADCLTTLVPILIEKYLPFDMYQKQIAEMFETTFSILKSKRFLSKQSTSQLLVKSLLNFAEQDSHLDMVHEWFSLDSLCEVAFTKEIQHLMVKQIFKSRSIK